MSGALGLFDFIKLRLVRLWPMIIVGAVLGICWRLFEGRFSVSLIIGAGLAALFMVPVPRFGQAGGDSFPINGPGWSVTHELLVNIAFAACARLLRARALWVCFAVAALGEIILAIKDGRCDWAVAWSDQPSAFIRALAPFLLGVLIHRAWPSRIDYKCDSLAIIGACVLVSVLLLPFNGIIYSLLCIFLVFPVVIMAGSLQVRWSPLRKALLVLGEISYPLYAINEPMARWMGYSVGQLGHGLNRGLLVLIIIGEIGLIVIAALAFSRIYDLPLRQWLRLKLLVAKT